MDGPYNEIITAYTSYFKSNQNVAHEIGHNLNMDHDFLGNNPWNKRTCKRNGLSCTGINSVMDYNQVISFQIFLRMRLQGQSSRSHSLLLLFSDFGSIVLIFELFEFFSSPVNFY